MRNGEQIIGVLIAAGGPRRFSPGRNWYLHRAVREVQEASNRAGLGLVEPQLAVVPDPDVGLRVVGLDRAIWSLIRRAVLVPEGHGQEASLRVDEHRLGEFRRLLMTMTPAGAALVHRASTRWAASVAMASKKRVAPSASSTAKVASSTPNRLGELADGNC